MESTLLFAIICVLCCLIQLNMFYTQWRFRLRIKTRERVIDLHQQGMEAGLCDTCAGEGCVGIFRSECAECRGFGYWFTPAGKSIRAAGHDTVDKAWDTSAG